VIFPDVLAFSKNMYAMSHAMSQAMSNARIHALSHAMKQPAGSTAIWLVHCLTLHAKLVLCVYIFPFSQGTD